MVFDALWQHRDFADSLLLLPLLSLQRYRRCTFWKNETTTHNAAYCRFFFISSSAAVQAKHKRVQFNAHGMVICAFYTVCRNIAIELVGECWFNYMQQQQRQQNGWINPKRAIRNELEHEVARKTVCTHRWKRPQPPTTIVKYIIAIKRSMPERARTHNKNKNCVQSRKCQSSHKFRLPSCEPNESERQNEHKKNAFCKLHVREMVRGSCGMVWNAYVRFSQHTHCWNKKREREKMKNKQRHTTHSYPFPTLQIPVNVAS